MANTAGSALEKLSEVGIHVICGAILLLRSPIVSTSDITNVAKRYSTNAVQNRNLAIKILEQQRLLGSGMYYGKKSRVNNRVTTSVGFAKLFPTTNSVFEQEKFSKHLAEYKLKLPQYLNYCKKYKQAKLPAQHGFSELAERLFESADYGDYVKYDKTKVLHPVATSLSENFTEKGKNVNDRFLPRKKRNRESNRETASSPQSVKRQRKSPVIAQQ
ncbi:unnamed protein product, partial [Didymodactylos carnosus]